MNNFIISIPLRYSQVKNIDENFRSLNLFSEVNYDDKISKRFDQNGKEYVACIYNSNQDTIPIQLEFIIRSEETNNKVIRNLRTGKEILNKAYIPETEKHITFIPKINNKSVVQQKEYEYLFTSNIQNIVHSKKLTTPMFFVVKMDRTEDVINGDYNIYRRGETKKNVVPSTRLDYSNRKPRALAIYRFTDDKFVPLSEFADEGDSTSYEVISDFMKSETYYPENKKITYDINNILKSIKLVNGKYKHTFFTFDGTKLYEVTSKYPIDYWEFVKLHPSNHIGYILSDEDFALEFYTEIPGKKKEKKKTVCYYNVKTKQFYK